MNDMEIGSILLFTYLNIPYEVFVVSGWKMPMHAVLLSANMIIHWTQGLNVDSYEISLDYISLTHWPIVDIGSGNGLVTSGKKPFLEPILETYDAIWSYKATRYSLRILNHYLQLIMKQHRNGWCLSTATIGQFIDILHLIFVFS